MSAFDSYVICTSPRSGSTLLCNLLKDTGVAGHPESYFHRASLVEWRAGLDLGLGQPTVKDPHTVLRETFNAAQNLGMADTGIFALRLMQHSAGFLFSQLGILFPGQTGDAKTFEAAFGKTRYIHLTRADKLAQAVSLVRAEQSGLWHKASDGTEIERTAPHQDPVYDADAIATQINAFTQFDRQWQDWFASQGIAPFHVTYEDLSQDPTSVLADILDTLGLDTHHARNVAPRVARLSDATSRTWMAQFRADNAAS